MSYLKVCVLRSSSSGNCTAIWTDRSGILIDCAGIGLEEIEKDLGDIELDPSRINGIVITHGHGDHICKNTFKIALRYGIPIYIHHDTYQVIKERYCVKDHQLKIIHHTQAPFIINDLNITPFKTFHSGGYVGKPFGFRVEYKDKGSCRKVGFLTDTSKVTDSMVRMLCDCKCLIIECNHDAELAQEISPDQSTWREHLNNEAAAEALVRIKNGSTDRVALKHVFLAHISERHNSPKTLISRISNDIRKENVTGCDLMLTYRGKRTKVQEML
ncbi:MAG: MBL fold metallo-hydrolase [Candidatus Omnitrophota bacterium]|nr:MBL fold metallo-hydrolase [Candidatus Omnitrophota bacterium]